MTPYAALLTYYAEAGAQRDLWAHLKFYAENGVAYLAPELAIMARPVCSGWPDAHIVGLTSCFAAQSLGLPDSPDAWHIHLAVGDLRRAFELMPFPLPFVTFQRGTARVRRYHLETIRRRHGILEAKSSRTAAARPNLAGYHGKRDPPDAPGQTQETVRR